MNENQNPNAVKLFDENAGAMALAQSDASAVARATQEIQAALVIAQRNPRDEVKLLTKIKAACKRRELAEVAEYEYNRGGTRITGPTIDLLRAIANRWGNIRHGWTETERGDGISTVRSFAWDMQTNTQAERTFKVRHWRDTANGGYALKDERDIYELLANAASRRVRACLEEVIDSDVIITAVDTCRETLKSRSDEEPLKDRAVKIVEEFHALAVTQEMIEARLGNKVEAISENQIASLRRVYKSLRDGVGTREDHFKMATSSPEFTPKSAGTAADAKAKIQSANKPTEPAAEKPAEPTEAPGIFNHLKALRGLAKMAGVKEPELLEFWAVTGATDGSHSSLEEVQIAMPKLIEQTSISFPAVAEQIKANRGGK